MRKLDVCASFKQLFAKPKPLFLFSLCFFDNDCLLQPHLGYMKNSNFVLDALLGAISTVLPETRNGSLFRSASQFSLLLMPVICVRYMIIRVSYNGNNFCNHFDSYLPRCESFHDTRILFIK